MDDASIFVADPSRSGGGPGGTHIITAANLMGEGTINLAGLLRIDPSAARRGELGVEFVNIDSTMDGSTGRSASTASAPVAQLLEETLAARGSTPLRDVAALQACIVADVVTILHGVMPSEGGEGENGSPCAGTAGVTTIRLSDFAMDVIEGGAALTSTAIDTRRPRMAARVREVLNSVCPTVRPNYRIASDVVENIVAEDGRPCRRIIFGGELDNRVEVKAAQPRSLSVAAAGAGGAAFDAAAGDDSSLMFVNLRDHRNVARAQPLPGTLRGELFVVAGTESLDAILARQLAPRCVKGESAAGGGGAAAAK
jgi:hypothetical protein